MAGVATVTASIIEIIATRNCSNASKMLEGVKYANGILSIGTLSMNVGLFFMNEALMDRAEAVHAEATRMRDIVDGHIGRLKNLKLELIAAPGEILKAA